MRSENVRENPIYVVVNIIDRNIYKVGSSKDPNKASKILADDFISEFENAGYSEEDFEMEVGKDDSWDLTSTSAWIVGKDEAYYDWMILEVYSEENAD